MEPHFETAKSRNMQALRLYDMDPPSNLNIYPSSITTAWLRLERGLKTVLPTMRVAAPCHRRLNAA